MAFHTWGAGGADVAWSSIASAAVPDPVRPERVGAPVWRRAGRLARLALAAVAPAVEHLRPTDPVLFGTGYGEFGCTASFLGTLYRKGPAGASPLWFQNAVHNAPASHLSMAFGLVGPSETLCAGPATTFATFERALAGMSTRRSRLLVVLADEAGPEVRAGLAHTGLVLGEGAAAFVLDAEPGGRRLWWTDAVEAGAWRRATAWPGEPPPVGTPGPEAVVGMTPILEALALAARAREGDAAVTDGRRTVGIA